MKRIVLTLLLVAAVVGGVSPLVVPSVAQSANQWVPVTGRIVTRTEVLAADGTVSTKWTTATQYSRSSSGSVLIQRMGRSGKPVSGTLMDFGNSQHTYNLSYQTGKVTDTHRAIDHNIVSHPPHGLTAGGPHLVDLSLGCPTSRSF
jgi:hypothetical protein